MNYIYWGGTYIVKNIIISAIVKEIAMVPIKNLSKTIYNKIFNKMQKKVYFNDIYLNDIKNNF